MSVEAPPRPPEQDELDALIEEARRRARRRRLTYASLLAAAALIAAGFYLLIGGGSDSGSSGSAGGEPNAGAGAAPTPSRADRAYRCPTSQAALERSSPPSGITACNIHFWATLPAGWHEDPSRAAVFPRSIIRYQGRLSTSPSAMGPPAVRFADFPLDSAPHEPPATMPHPLSPDGIAIVVSADSPLKDGSARAHPKDLRPSDFVVGASGRRAAASLDTGGWRFHALVQSGAGSIRPDALAKATGVLKTIVTTEHLCPCGSRGHTG